MPIIRRKGIGRIPDLEQLTELQIDWLLYATNWFGDTDIAEDIELSRTAWDMHRDALLPQFIKDYPGRRPFAWWIFDHGKERPIINNPLWNPPGKTPSPLLSPEIIAQYRAEKLGYLHTEIWAGGIYAEGSEGLFQEDQTAYLLRHNLLTPEEIKCLESSEDT